MTDPQDPSAAALADALARILPRSAAVAINQLADLLAAIASGAITPADAATQLQADPALLAALQQLGSHDQAPERGLSALLAALQQPESRDHETERALIALPHTRVGRDLLIENVAGRDLTQITLQVPPRSGQTERSQRSRATLIERIRSMWISDVLEQVLTADMRIALGLTEQPDAVMLPLAAQMQELRRPPRPLPSDLAMGALFEQANGALLILGAPGAGKTMLLLDLARDLLAQAVANAALPVPVVLNLASWAAARQPLDTWLVEELRRVYYVPKETAQEWLQADQLVLLLDGLDEVRQDARSACVAAINHFRAAHGLTQLAVCSRMAAYTQLDEQLQLRRAVCIQPLSAAQVAAFLQRAGAPLAGLRAAMAADAGLRELLDTPLLLGIAALTYRGQSAAHIQSVGSAELQRQRLFDAYIGAMFARRGQDLVYPRTMLLGHLRWLAGQLVQHDQTMFALEQIQPDWLPTGYRWLLGYSVSMVLALALGLIVTVLSTTIFTLLRAPGDVALGGLLIGGISSIMGGLIGLTLNFLNPKWISVIRSVDILRWRWTRRGLLDRTGTSIRTTLWPCIGFGVCGGAAVGAITGPPIGVSLGLLAGLGGGLVSGLLISLIRLFIEIIQEGVLIEEMPLRATPNEGIHRSARNALVFSLLAGPLFGLAVGLVFGLTMLLMAWVVGVLLGNWVQGLNAGLFLGLGFGAVSLFVGTLIGFLMSLVQFGGYAVIQHYCLRLLLWHSRRLPLRLIELLEAGVARIFLRRVGGSYMFIHRLLMEHFAALPPEAAPPAQEHQGRG